MMPSRSMKYNPAFLSDEALIASFVSRHVDLELILETIQENADDSNQHVLLIGPRGIGKTTLVLRVAAEIRAADDLQERWYPLVFGEESYGVSTPGEFWLEALLHLGGQTQDERWQQAYEELRTERDEDRLRRRALIQLMDFADEHGKRLLLIVENLNMLIGAQMSSDDAWGLRHTLVNEPRLMLLGTATSRFEEVEDYGQALYDLFKLVELEPLGDEDTRALWTSITGKTPSSQQIRPVQILTGGNPRLIRILSEFAADVSFSELMDDMIHLVDEHTEYFKHHLDSLPVQERKVFVALADLWDPSPARKVAELARLDVNKASALLRRLTDRGAVTVPYQRGRAKYYQVAERMYNVYHLMRRRGQAASRVQAVVRFMTHLYQGEQLAQATRSMLEEASDLTCEQRRPHLLAYQTILERANEPALHDQLVEAAAPYLTAMPDAPASVLEMMGDLETESLAALTAPSEKRADLLELDIDEVDDTETLLSIALALTEQPDRQGEAETAYRKVLQKESENLPAHVGLGGLLNLQGRHSEALEVLERIFTLDFALDEVNSLAWHSKGAALKGLGRNKEALGAYEQTLALNETNALAWQGKGVVLLNIGRHQEALEAFEQALALGETSTYTWHGKGGALKGLGRHKEALDAYNQALALDETRASVWYGEGFVFLNLDRHEEALDAFAQALALDKTEAHAWRGKGFALYSLGRPKEAIEAFEQALALNETDADVWLVKGVALKSLRRHEEALHAFDRLLALNEISAPVWSEKGATLVHLGRHKEALDAFEHALALNETNVATWHNKGTALSKLDRPKEALDAFERVLTLDKENTAAWYSKGLALLDLDRPEEALDALEESLRHFDHAPETLNSLAWMFYETGWSARFSQAEAWARRAVEQEPDNGYYRHTLATLLGAQDQWPEALSHAHQFLHDTNVVEATLDEVINFFVGAAAAGRDDEALQQILASPSAELLEPLTVALRMRHDQEVNVAREIYEVARDVIGRIEARIEAREEMHHDASEEAAKA